MAAGTLRQICVGSVCTIAPLPENAYRPYALRHPVLAFLTTFLLITKLGGIALVALTPNIASLATISVSVLVRDTNAARQEAGLPPLEEHPLLMKSAEKKAADMLAHDYFEHTSPTGVTPWKWFDDAGYGYVYAGENLAIDFTSADAVHAAWMRSPGHKKNILSDKYRQIGIAVATGEFEGRTTTVIVQHFGSLVADVVVKQPSTKSPVNQPSEPTHHPASTPRPTPQPTIAPPSPPEILQPSEGQILPSGASTVRGISEQGTRVHVALDGSIVGTYEAADGTFSGIFRVPPEEEREAILTATASRGVVNSTSSTPRRIVLDTQGPRIAGQDATYLPDPSGHPGRVTLLLPIQGRATDVTATSEGNAFPLTIRGSIAIVTLPVERVEHPVTIRATDANGNTRVTSVQPTRTYHVTPRTAGEADTRIRVLTVTSYVQSVTTGILAVIALLLVMNVFIYIRIQHADLITHALFVLVLGALLLTM